MVIRLKEKIIRSFLLVMILVFLLFPVFVVACFDCRVYSKKIASLLLLFFR